MKNIVVATTVNTFMTTAPFLLGEKEGIFSSLGLNVSVVQTLNDVQAVIGGQAQFYTDSPFTAVAQGANVIAVAQYVPNNPQAIIANPSIKTLQDLNGKTFGCTKSGALTCIVPYLLINYENWTYTSNSIKPVGSLSSILTAFENGNIQAFVWNFGTAVSLQDSGKAIILGNVGQILPQWYGEFAVTTTQFASQDPNSLRLFLAGV
ncbi:MAG: ABC transporter substrate-binding protein, partial [Thaumarchaeota archaeon]|nr:ABC transporter substrate-binding protein [Nitrososphaerota archaeon]